MGAITEFFGEANAALDASIRSIVFDGSLSLVAKRSALDETLAQYREHVRPAIVKIGKALTTALVDRVPVTIASDAPPRVLDQQDIVTLAMRINNSDLPADQLATLGDGGPFYAELVRRSEEARSDDQTSEQAFAQFSTGTSDGIALFAAHRKLARPSVRKSAYRGSVVAVAKGDAYGQLEALAKRVRAADPKLSEAQAFAKVFADPVNGRLAAASLGKAAAPDAEPSELEKPSMTPSLRALYGMADDLRTKQPKLTEAQAFARAMDTREGKKLYQAYKAEINQGAHQ